MEREGKTTEENAATQLQKEVVSASIREEFQRRYVQRDVRRDAWANDSFGPVNNGPCVRDFSKRSPAKAPVEVPGRPALVGTGPALDGGLCSSRDRADLSGRGVASILALLVRERGLPGAFTVFGHILFERLGGTGESFV